MNTDLSQLELEYYWNQLPWYCIPAMLILSLSSWLVESFKWKLLVSDVQFIRFRESIRQNLTAQAASFITPLRAGEFALKAMFFPKQLSKRIIERVTLGNLLQMLVTVSLGLSGLFFYRQMEYDSFSIYLAASILVIGGFGVYYFIQKWWKLPTIPIKITIKAALLSLLRYQLFSTSWLVLILAFNTEAELLVIVGAITVFYLVVSVLPLIQLLDVPVRMTVASLVLGSLFFDSNLILVMTLLVWTTNTILPTLLGCFMLNKQPLKAITT